MNLRVALLVGVIFGCSSLLQANAFSATPEWIWTSDKPAEREVEYFRKTFEISKPVKSAELMLAVDNVGRAWLNGQDTFENRAWERPHAEKVADKLKQGENMLSIRTENHGGQAGLLCKLTVTYEDGSKLEVVSDKSFLVNRAPEDKIRRADFDPKGWVAASSD